MKSKLKYLIPVFILISLALVPVIAPRLITINGVTINLSRDTSVTISANDTSFKLTTVGTSGAATFINDTLNIPIYSGGGGVLTAIYNKWGSIIIGTDSIKIDSTLLETKLYALKQVDSVAALIPSLSGYATTIAVGDTANGIRSYTLSLLSSYALNISLTDSVALRVRYIDSNVYYLTPHDTLNKWLPIGTVLHSGTVTSIATSTGLLGGTITTSGTLQIDSSIIPKWDDTLSGNRWLVTVNYLKSFNYGIGTITSISSGYGLTGGTITTSGTFAVDTTKLIPQNDTGINISTHAWVNAKGYLTSLVAGTNIYVSGNTITANQNPVDSSVIFSSIVYSTTASSSSAGRTTLYSNNMSGIDVLSSIPSVGNEYQLQASIANEKCSRVFFYHSGLYIDGVFGSNFTNITTTANSQKGYDATNMLPNFSYQKQTTASTANTSAAYYLNTGTEVVYTGASQFGNGGIYNSWFGLPTVTTAERVFVGFWAGGGAVPGASADPSALTNIVGIGKDAADTAISFYFNGSSGTATKIGTTVKLNANNVYTVTVFIPSNSTTMYVAFQVRTKTSITTYSTSATTKIPAAGVGMQPYMWINTGTSASSVALAIISTTLEEFR